MPDRPHDEGIRPGRPPDRDGGPPPGEPSRFEVAFTLRPEDWLAFNDYHAAKRGRAGRSSLWWAFPVLLLLAGLLYLLASDSGAREAMILFVAAVLLSGVYVLARLLHRSAIRRNARRDPTFPRKRRIVLTPEAVEGSTEVSTARTLWEGVLKVAATETHLFIYLAPTQAIVIPGRAFPSDEDFDDFIDAARDYHRAARRRRDEE